MMHNGPDRRISFVDLGHEPFRIFFPAGVLAGITGVALWPLYFGGVTQMYPGIGHARIMACGLFGAFILGFLGAAMPRMLSTKPLRPTEVFPLVLLHGAMVVCLAASPALADRGILNRGTPPLTVMGRRLYKASLHYLYMYMYIYDLLTFCS